VGKEREGFVIGSGDSGKGCGKRGSEGRVVCATEDIDER
jgi:hypothetical protein